MPIDFTDLKRWVLSEHARTGAFPGILDFDAHRPAPSARTIQRHGGIISLYEKMELEYVPKTHGAARALRATTANHNAFSTESDMYQKLTTVFGDRNVHRQSPYDTAERSLCRSDFKVFPEKTQPFFIDVFQAANMHNLIGCVNAKLKKIIPLKVTAPIFFVSLEEEFVNPYAIKQYIAARKTRIPANITLCTKAECLRLIGVA